MIEQFSAGATTGLALAVVTVAGLWWTVRSLPRSHVPWLLLSASAAARLTLVVLGLWWMSQIGSAALLGCISTLVAGRYLLMLMLRSKSMVEPGGSV